MVTKRVVINLVVFFTAAFALVGYGAFTLLGNPFRDARTARVMFDDASGLLPGFSASLDGVVIGTVDSVELAEDGVEVTVDLDEGRTLPGDVEARVIRASAVGEQRVEFTPMGDGEGDPIPDGGLVPTAEGATPPEVSDVLDLANRFVTAIPAEDLNTVVHELAVAFRGREEDLAGFAGDIDTFNREFLEHEESFRRLLESGPRVLDALTEVAPEFREALENTATFTGTLAERRRDMTSLMVNGAEFAETAGPLLDSQMANLACLFHDSATLNSFLSEPEVLRSLQVSFDMNQAFFGPIDALAVEGPAVGFPQFGSQDRGDQAWLRVQTLLPPEEPHASRYLPVRGTPNTLPGPGCTNDFGPGPAPVTQAEGGFEPIREDAMAPAGTESIPLAPHDGDTDSGGEDTDPDATNETPHEPERSGSGDAEAEDELVDTEERSLQIDRPEDEGGSAFDDPLWLALALGLVLAAAGYLWWGNRRGNAAG
jgi:phospholipid/cholesterol/gamma-HCH transport system substrate-binding protein